MTQSFLVGILVGGSSSRMGGRPKGLLPSADGSGRSLVQRLGDEVRAALPGAQLVLCGDQPSYSGLPWERLTDAMPKAGPLGGVVALLMAAQERRCSHAIALSCDLPHISQDVLRRLGQEAPEARVLCPRSAGKYEPLIARYRLDCLNELRRALDSGHRGLQPVLARLGARELVLTLAEQRQIVDWDGPQDVEPD